MYRLSRPSITYLKNTGSRKFTVKWKKVSGATGYQVSYRIGSAASKRVTVKGSSTVSKSITGLSKGKTYKAVSYTHLSDSPSTFEGETEKTPLTEEQIQTVLGMYALYQQQWAENADVLGVQMPFYLQYNDNNEDGLGALEMCIRDSFGGGRLFVMEMENRIAFTPGMDDGFFVIAPDPEHEGYFLPYLYLILEQGAYQAEVEQAIRSALEPHQQPVEVTLIKERSYFHFKTNRRELAAEIAARVPVTV